MNIQQLFKIHPRLNYSIECIKNLFGSVNTCVSYLMYGNSSRCYAIHVMFMALIQVFIIWANWNIWRPQIGNKNWKLVKIQKLKICEMWFRDKFICVHGLTLGGNSGTIDPGFEPVRGTEWLSCHTCSQEVSRCCTRGESQGKYNMYTSAKGE